MDKLINYGGAVKALGDGRVGGYLVLFGDAENTDISSHRDFFTRETVFDIGDGAKSAVYYRHALEPELDRKLTDAELKTDDVGVWVEGQLNLRDRYEKAVYGMAEAKKLGWSSGTAVHLVQREKQENGAHKILRWPLGLDASLTPDPAEPRTQALALKSLADLPATPSLAELCPAIKAEYLGEYVEQSMGMAALRALNDALMYEAVYRCLGDEQMAAADKLAHLKGALEEFALLAYDTLARFVTAPDAGELKALQLLWGPLVPEALADHSAKVVTANADFASRLEGRLEARTQAGRSLSAANRQELKAALDSLEGIDAVRERLAGVLQTSEPEQTDDVEAPALALDRLRLRARALVLAGHH